MGGTREHDAEIENDVATTPDATAAAGVTGPPADTGAAAQEHEKFVERMEAAARGVPGAVPADNPDLTGEDRFDAG